MRRCPLGKMHSTFPHLLTSPQPSGTAPRQPHFGTGWRQLHPPGRAQKCPAAPREARAVPDSPCHRTARPGGRARQPGGSRGAAVPTHRPAARPGLAAPTWRRAGGSRGSRHGPYSQSRCFFLGPITSWVVALQTALATAEPVTLCCAAAMRSVSDCPDMAGLPLPPPGKDDGEEGGRGR